MHNVLALWWRHPGLWIVVPDIVLMAVWGIWLSEILNPKPTRLHTLFEWVQWSIWGVFKFTFFGLLPAGAILTMVTVAGYSVTANSLPWALDLLIVAVGVGVAGFYIIFADASDLLQREYQALAFLQRRKFWRVAWIGAAVFTAVGLWIVRTQENGLWVVVCATLAIVFVFTPFGQGPE